MSDHDDQSRVPDFKHDRYVRLSDANRKKVDSLSDDKDESGPKVREQIREWMEKNPQPGRLVALPRGVHVSPDYGLLIGMMKHAIENAVRWHYYEYKRGSQTYDPGQNGMDPDILEQMEAVLPKERVEHLKREANAWANWELEQRRDGTDWQEAKEAMGL